MQVLGGVDDVVTPDEALRGLLSATNTARLIFIGLSVVLLVSSLFLIVNTIRLATFARRREIEVMKLVGAVELVRAGPVHGRGSRAGPHRRRACRRRGRGAEDRASTRGSTAPTASSTEFYVTVPTPRRSPSTCSDPRASLIGLLGSLIGLRRFLQGLTPRARSQGNGAPAMGVNRTSFPFPGPGRFRYRGVRQGPMLPVWLMLFTLIPSMRRSRLVRLPVCASWRLLVGLALSLSVGTRAAPTRRRTRKQKQLEDQILEARRRGGRGSRTLQDIRDRKAADRRPRRRARRSDPRPAGQARPARGRGRSALGRIRRGAGEVPGQAGRVRNRRRSSSTHRPPTCTARPAAVRATTTSASQARRTSCRARSTSTRSTTKQQRERASGSPRPARRRSTRSDSG